MKRIEPRELAIEGVITRHGTLVGPLMAELTGFPELTPYDGGWCGNDVSPELLTEKQRRTARERTIAMGERLRQEGYRGYFELDFLLDADTGEMWLGELNPRVTGASSITNVTAVAYGDMPLFLFHLLEFMDVDFEIDVEELNERWAQTHNLDEWTQFILKQTEDVTELITEAPRSGIWRLGGDGISFARRDTDWHTVADETEAFYLRIAGVGSVPLPRSRSRHHGHARPVHGRGARAARSCARVDHGHQGASSRACRRAPTSHRWSSPSRSASRCSSRSVVASASPTWEHLADMRMIPFTFRARRGARARPEMAGGLRGEVAALQDVVPARGGGRSTVLRHERADAARAHARAGARVRAGGRARGRWRPRRADALAVQAAALPGRVLPGRVDARRRSHARSQLRLRAVAVRRAHLVDPAARETGRSA